MFFDLSTSHLTSSVYMSIYINYYFFYVIFVLLEDQGLPEEVFCNKNDTILNGYSEKHNNTRGVGGGGG